MFDIWAIILLVDNKQGTVKEMTSIKSRIESEIKGAKIVSDLTAQTGSEYFQFIYKDYLISVRCADHVAGNETKRNSFKNYGGLQEVFPNSFCYRAGISFEVKGTIKLNINPNCSYKTAIKYLESKIN